MSAGAGSSTDYSGWRIASTGTSVETKATAFRSDERLVAAKKRPARILEHGGGSSCGPQFQQLCRNLSQCSVATPQGIYRWGRRLGGTRRRRRKRIPLMSYLFLHYGRSIRTRRRAAFCPDRGWEHRNCRHEWRRRRGSIRLKGLKERYSVEPARGLVSRVSNRGLAHGRRPPPCYAWQTSCSCAFRSDAGRPKATAVLRWEVGEKNAED